VTIRRSSGKVFQRQWYTESSRDTDIRRS